MARYPQRDRLLDEVQRVMRTRGLRRRTQTTYLAWIRRFLTFHGARHPRTLSRVDVEQYLSHLANERGLAAKTRNQAASAIGFLFREVLGSQAVDQVKRARGPSRLPTVLSAQEALRVLGELSGTKWLIGALLYGTGVRVSECHGLRLKDLDFELGRITVRDGKGGKDRVVMLPASLTPQLRQQINRVRRQHRVDRGIGGGWAPLPGALHRKMPDAGYALAWQFLFPARKQSRDPATGRRGRYHVHPSAFQRAVTAAVRQSGIMKRASSHTFRHSFATQMLYDGHSLLIVQKLLGHKDIRTTMRYLHVVDQVGFTVRSPLDRMLPGSQSPPGETQDRTPHSQGDGYDVP